VAGRVLRSDIVGGAARGADPGCAPYRRFQGKDLVTGALRAVLPRAFEPLHLHRIAEGYIPADRRPDRVLRRPGLRRRARARRFLLVDGRWRDRLIEERLNPAWISPRS